MTRKLLTVDEFRSSAKEGARPEGTVLRFATEAPTELDNRTMRFVFSDASVDRSGDTISADGWDLTSFNKNPVALWAHDSFSPPIGRASNVGASKGKLIGDIEFMPPEISPFADSIYLMVKGGYLNAVSVGFIPLEYSFTSDKDRPYGIDFEKQELLEISVCPVPCNPNALGEARAKGIDTAPLREWAEKLLDFGGAVLVPRQLLEETFKAAKTPHTTRQKYLAAKAETPLAAPVELVAPEGKDMGDGTDEAVVPPPGYCGRSMGETCGMTNPSECAVHAAAMDNKAIQHKGGRRISSANADRLNKAVEHIQAVIGSNDPDGDGDNDTPGAGGDTDNDGGNAGNPGDADPFNFTSQRESAKKLLAETRAAQERDLTA